MKALSGKGRAALVTGARRGIGLGIAKALLAEGYAVLLCGVTEEPRATADIAPELTRLGTWAYLRCDVSNAQDREALFAGMEEKFGRLDVLVNNAGVADKYRRMIEQEGVTPIRRFGQPEDVADQVLAACSGLLDFGTGTVLNADGGFHLRRL